MADNNNDILQIRLHVYDTEFPVKIKRAEEPLYRDAATLVTNTLNTYASFYKGKKSDKDLLYMALIEIALRYEKEAERNDTEPYIDILKKLTSEIEETI